MNLRSLICGLLALVASPAFAQAPAPVPDVDAQKARISAERKAAEASYDQARADCYQKFAVQDCINDARRGRRAQVDALNRQEAAINDAERQRRAAAQLDRLDQKGQTPADEAANRERALQSQKDREQRAADRDASRQAKEAQEAASRRAFDNKQRANAQEKARQAEERAQEQAERQRYEDRLKKAEQDRAELDARNAKRTKPRAAPLPTPP